LNLKGLTINFKANARDFKAHIIHFMAYPTTKL